MAILAEVTGHNFITRINGVAQKAPIGHKIVVNQIPTHLSSKLKYVRDAQDSDFVVNDSPHAARLREEGEHEKADKVMAKGSDVDNEERNKLRASYEDLTGEAADRRWTVSTLKKKIADFTEAGE